MGRQVFRTGPCSSGPQRGVIQTKTLSKRSTILHDCIFQRFPMTQEHRFITDCNIDTERLAVFGDCKETSGMDHNAAQSEWPWNVLSKNAIAYSCGAIARPGVPIRHKHLPQEF